MVKSEAALHPWRVVHHDPLREQRYARAYKNIGRDLKIGQVLVMLVVVIFGGLTVLGGVSAIAMTNLTVPNLAETNGAMPAMLMNRELGEMVKGISYQYVVIVCTLTIIECIFLYLGSKYVYRLLVFELLPVAIGGLVLAGYLIMTQGSPVLGITLMLVLSPYYLCFGILTLSWRAKLYLSYMNREL